eukprot:TRINITY_DN368_c0_g1_i2.p1 TRINITY_DN368_c0_g1~~TRINITY_DN368_c0_g1_i2.p1  ORF type:complete len:169 (+),score=28.55 TRINITY_DN368_c0_g1_i2:61-507(+)
MAPEAFQSNGFTNKSNIFSFGMILYYIMTGMEATEGVVNKGALVTRLSQNIQPMIPDSVPGIIREMIRRCWDQKPELRPTSFNYVRPEKFYRDHKHDALQEWSIERMRNLEEYINKTKRILVMQYVALTRMKMISLVQGSELIEQKKY